MFTRRFLAVAIPAIVLSPAAWATRPLRPEERTALQAIQSSTAQVASQLQALTADHLRVADVERARNAELARKLTDLVASLRAGIEMLDSARAAFPASLRPRTSSLPTPITPIGPRTARDGPVLRPSVTVSTPPPTFVDVLGRTRFPMNRWRQVADALNVTEVATGAGLRASIGHYRRASAQFVSANRILRDIDPVASVRNQLLEEELADSNDRLGNFEIQDLMRRRNQSETVSSSVQKALDDASETLVRNIG